MKQLLLAVAVCASIAVRAQSPALQAMVASERAFAASALQQGTRDAFLAFMDTSAVMFDKDSFAKAFPVWQAKTARPGLLDWKPVVAEVSPSGDWGFTTGPWTFRPTEKDTVAARGHFFTIWHRTAAGWKFLFDCGADGGREPLDLLYPFQATATPGDTASLFMADRDFNTLLEAAPADAHRRYLSLTSALCRNGGVYAITPGQQAHWLKALPPSIQVAPKGYLLSPRLDYALVYGVTSGGHPEPCLRLWRHEPGGWKLAVELLRL